MIPFPSVYEKKSLKFVDDEDIYIYCHCREPESSALMISVMDVVSGIIRSVNNPSHKEN